MIFFSDINSKRLFLKKRNNLEVDLEISAKEVLIWAKAESRFGETSNTTFYRKLINSPGKINNKLYCV